MKRHLVTKMKKKTAKIKYFSIAPIEVEWGGYKNGMKISSFPWGFYTFFLLFRLHCMFWLRRVLHSKMKANIEIMYEKSVKAKDFLRGEEMVKRHRKTHNTKIFFRVLCCIQPAHWFDNNGKCIFTNQ